MNQNVFRGLFAVGCVAILALLAPIIWAAASAGAGLLVIGVLVLAIGAAIQTLPLLGQKLENWILGRRRAEAAKNPIEQLYNDLKRRSQLLGEFKRAVAFISTQIRGLEDMVKEWLKTNPNYDATEQNAAIKEMWAAHAVMKDKFERGEVALEAYSQKIKESEFKWKFGQAGKKALSTISAIGGEDIMNKMLADTAFAAVRDDYNAVFAEIEMEASKLNSGKALGYQGGLTLDVSNIHFESLEPVR